MEQNQELIRDVSTEELMELKKKAAKHSKSMEAVKNVRDVVSGPKSATKLKMKTKKPAIGEPTVKLKQAKHKPAKRAEDDGWLDDFSAMSSKTTHIETSSNDGHRAKHKPASPVESFNQKSLEQIKLKGSEPDVALLQSEQTEEISMADVSHGHHQDEVISEDILEELGVKPTTDQPEAQSHKPLLIPGIKVFKKPISSPVVDSPPPKPLGPRDDLSEANVAEVEPPAESAQMPSRSKKARFGLRFKLKKNHAQPESEAEPSEPTKPEVKHVLYQDPVKEAEQRAEHQDELLISGELEEALLVENKARESAFGDTNQPKTVIRRDDFKLNLQHQVEERPSEMVFNPEARVIKNIQKKPSGYSMVAVISEGGYAFRSKSPGPRPSSDSNKEHKFSDIEKANKKKIMRNRSSGLGILDIISIVVILAALGWFFYLIFIA